MGPSFSSKNGVRYRFYVSTALRGGKTRPARSRRISAPEIETLVEMSLREQLNNASDNILENVERVVVSAGTLQVTLRSRRGKNSQIKIPWAPKVKGEAQVLLAGRPKLTKSCLKAFLFLIFSSSDAALIIFSLKF